MLRKTEPYLIILNKQDEEMTMLPERDKHD